MRRETRFSGAGQGRSAPARPGGTTPGMFDAGPSPRARLGFVILATDRTSEAELTGMAPEGVGVHFSRIGLAGEITPESLRSMQGSITRAASLILPDEGVDALCFHCTSGSLLMGERAVTEALAAGGTARSCTTVLTAVVEALRALQVTRFSLVTPYLGEITTAMAEYFRKLGFALSAVEGMGLCRDSEIARVSPGHIMLRAAGVDRADAQAVFVSCTGLRSAGIIAELEALTGKPVITSTQAAMWHMLRTSGVRDALAGYGRLLENC